MRIKPRPAAHAAGFRGLRVPDSARADSGTCADYSAVKQLACQRESRISARRRHDLEAVAAQARRDEQQDVIVVIRDEDQLTAHATSSWSAVARSTPMGSSTRNVVPPPSRPETAIVPSCAS